MPLIGPLWSAVRLDNGPATLHIRGEIAQAHQAVAQITRRSRELQRRGNGGGLQQFFNSIGRGFPPCRVIPFKTPPLIGQKARPQRTTLSGPGSTISSFARRSKRSSRPWKLRRRRSHRHPSPTLAARCDWWSPAISRRRVGTCLSIGRPNSRESLQTRLTCS
jgi:hypothetical protein